jgi:hypothetical protein
MCECDKQVLQYNCTHPFSKRKVKQNTKLQSTAAAKLEGDMFFSPYREHFDLRHFPVHADTSGTIDI